MSDSGVGSNAVDEMSRDRDSRETRLAIAVHEAAHAVVSVRLELPVNGVTLRPPDLPNTDDGMDEDTFDSMAGSLGLSLPADYSDELYPELARSTIVAGLAGPLAEMRVSGTVDLMGSLGDITDAVHTAEVLTGDRGARALGRECQREASAIIERDWATIVALAAELVEAPTGVLDGQRVREAVRRADETRGR